MANQELMLTIAEFAARLGVTVPTIRTYVKMGKIIPSSVVGKHMYFTEESVERYCGVFSGKKRNGSDKVESYAVIYVSDSNEETPKDTIDKIMTDSGLLSVNSFNRDTEISAEEEEAFKEFCDKKNLLGVVRAKVNNAQKSEINKVEAEYQDGRNKAVANTYMKVVGLQAILCNPNADKAEREKAVAQHRAYKEELEQTIERIDAEEIEKKQLIKEEYSSEFVDEYGNIPEEKKCDSKCTKYARAYKSVRLTFIRMFRASMYNSVNYYALFTVNANDLDTLEIPLGNILNKCYTKVFVVNKDKLSEDIKKVLHIINKTGVSEVLDLHLIDEVKD